MGVQYINLGQNKKKSWGLLNTVMNIRIQEMRAISCPYEEIITFQTESVFVKLIYLFNWLVVSW